MSTIGGGIARVEIEFQHLGAAESLGGAQQTDRAEICIPPPTSLTPHCSHHTARAHLCFPIPQFSLLTPPCVKSDHALKLASDSTQQLTQVVVSKWSANHFLPNTILNT